MIKENILGYRLKNIREEIGYSQNEVVEKLLEKGISMSRETLSKIENNNRTISAIELKALCDIYNIDIDDLFDGDEKEDLVTLFRKKGNFNKQNLGQIEEIQDMLKVFLVQEKIYKGEYQPVKKKPLWEEFSDGR
jgi:transcriptional regulator with XRE-family HTH domain